MAQSSKRRRGEGRVAFLVHRDAIRIALLEGWPRAAVHGRMRDVLWMSYQQFARYVDRYLPDTREAHRLPTPQRAAARQPLAPPPSPAPPPPVVPSATPGPARFVYDPVRQSRDNLV